MFFLIYIFIHLFFWSLNSHIKPAWITNKGPITEEYIKQFLSPKCVILEAGAHNGSDSVKIAKLLPDCTIYAFEPQPLLFQQLLNNTRAFKHQIHCYQLALSDVNGSAEFYVSNGLDNGSSSLLKPDYHLIFFPQVQFNQKIMVQTKTLDTWAKENGIEKIDFLRLDMQGYEPKMLAASPNMLKKVKVIYTEVSTKELYKGIILYPQYNKWLQELGFTLVREEVSPDFGGDALFVKFN